MAIWRTSPLSSRCLALSHLLGALVLTVSCPRHNLENMQSMIKSKAEIESMELQEEPCDTVAALHTLAGDWTSSASPQGYCEVLPWHLLREKDMEKDEMFDPGCSSGDLEGSLLEDHSEVDLLWFFPTHGVLVELLLRTDGQ